MQEAPGKAYRALKKLGASPGDADQESGFMIPSHVEQNLSAKQSAEKLGEYFSTISQQYALLDIDKLEERVKNKSTSTLMFFSKARSPDIVNIFCQPLIFLIFFKNQFICLITLFRCLFSCPV